MSTSRNVVLTMVSVIVILLAGTQAVGQETMLEPGWKIDGLMRVERWHGMKLYTYKIAKDNETKEVGFNRKLKGVKDLRAFRERHPKWQKMHDACDWLQPIVGIGGNVAISLLTATRAF